MIKYRRKSDGQVFDLLERNAMRAVLLLPDGRHHPVTLKNLADNYELLDVEQEVES